MMYKKTMIWALCALAFAGCGASEEPLAVNDADGAVITEEESGDTAEADSAASRLAAGGGGRRSSSAGGEQDEDGGVSENVGEEQQDSSSSDGSSSQERLVVVKNQRDSNRSAGQSVDAKRDIPGDDSGVASGDSSSANGGGAGSSAGGGSEMQTADQAMEEFFGQPVQKMSQDEVNQMLFESGGKPKYVNTKESLAKYAEEYRADYRKALVEGAKIGITPMN